MTENMKEELPQRNLRTKTPLRQSKLNFAQIASGKYDKQLGFSDSEDFEEKPKKRKSKRATTKRVKKYNADDELDEFMNSNTKKKVKRASSSAVKKEKEPDNNMGFLIGWRNDIKVQKECKDAKLGKVVKVNKIASIDFQKQVQDLQGIYININWSKEQKIRQAQLKDLRNLQLEPKKICRNGIIFIWTDKNEMAEIMNIMDQKQFVYIENFSVFYLGLQSCEKMIEEAQSTQKVEKNLMTYFNTKPTLNDPKIQKPNQNQSIEERKQKVMDNLSLIKGYNINDIILKTDSEHYRESKKIMLMFRRQVDKDVILELRHQRTSDVVFDLVDENNPQNFDSKSNQYTYQMIETLLPKARVGVSNNQFKLMELYADSSRPRENWLGFSEN